MPTDSTSQTITLRDGRALGFAEYGDPGGKPVFHFNGACGSRFERPTDEGVLAGLRYIATDRPGHGLSDFQPGRRLLDWPDDVAQLADHLGISQFYVVGFSAGGPHALACAYRLPDRVLACASVSGLAPTNRPGALRGLPLQQRLYLISAQKLPWIIHWFRRLTRNMILSDPEKAARQILAHASESDKALLFTPENLAMLAENTGEGMRPGWQGVTLDDRIIASDWQFELADVRVRVDIWQGTEDNQVPLHAGEYLRDHLPNNRAMFFPGEGHMLLFKHWGEILAALVQERKQ